VIRRCRTPLVVLTAVFGLAGSAQASGMATYQLINTAPAGSATVTQVVASVLPAGSVPDGTNPKASANPLSVLSGSSGFNAGNLVDFLGSGTLANNDPIEVIKLQFDNQGLAPGGVLNFGLMLDPSYNGPPPTLMLAPLLHAPAASTRQGRYAPDHRRTHTCPDRSRRPGARAGLDRSLVSRRESWPAPRSGLSPRSHA